MLGVDDGVRQEPKKPGFFVNGDIFGESTGGKDSDMKGRKLIKKLANSRLAAWFLRFPPFAIITKKLISRRIQAQLQPVSSRVATRPAAAHIGLDLAVQDVVRDVVNVLGYTGACVAIYEQGDSLTIRAIHVDPSIVAFTTIRDWEEEISQFTPNPFRLTDPETVKVYRYDARYQENLSIRAFEAGKPIVSNELYDLLNPVAPPVSRPTVMGIQEALGIRQVIAVPLVVEVEFMRGRKKEVVGVLLAAKNTRITDKDNELLGAFSRQAAAAIEMERRRLQNEVAQELVYTLHTHLDSEERILRRIAEGIVKKLGYVAVMVGTYEADDSISVQAYHVDPNIATPNDIEEMERAISAYTSQPLHILDPDVARVYRYEKKYQDNLSIRAVEAALPLDSGDLFDLFHPIVPEEAREVVRDIQETLGIKRVISVPFFLETRLNGDTKKEIIGNLFVASRSRSFSFGEISLLQAFGQQAAVGIRNARLYRRAEELRQSSLTFGKMAFSATAHIHRLRNNIGAFGSYIEVLQMLANRPEFDERVMQSLKRLMSQNEEVFERLNQTRSILDHLHEPWREVEEAPTDVNKCLDKAIEKVLPKPKFEADQHLFLTKRFEKHLPTIRTSTEMLIEAFRVIIQNAVEAIADNPEGGNLHILSAFSKEEREVTVKIRDNGAGIKPENLEKIFEMRWSTKKAGMGFGLYWAKDFIEGMGGSILVESEEGEGTSFEIQLPIHENAKGHIFGD